MTYEGMHPEETFSLNTAIAMLLRPNHDLRTGFASAFPFRSCL